MNILISGVFGFVGENLLNKFKGSYILNGLDIIDRGNPKITNFYVWGDLENNIRTDIDAIIHLAGKAHDTKNQALESEYFEINTGLTKKLFDYFLQSSASKFIFFSSVKAAASRVEGEFLTENVIPSPEGPYGESKIAAEEYILANLPRDPRKKVYILRPCMIHGPGNKGNLNLLYNVVSKKLPWPLGAFENKRSFSSIDNVCAVVEGLLNKEVPTGIYNMADDEALSTNDLIELMCGVMGIKPRIWRINRNLMERLAVVGGKLHLPLNEDRIQKLTENYVVSNEKVKKALGWEKMPLTAREGFEKTIRSFQKK
jgi:nucleoside-diphosphate-sugar epimerase